MREWTLVRRCEQIGARSVFSIGAIGWLFLGAAGAAPLDFADPAVLSERSLTRRGEVKFERVDEGPAGSGLHVTLPPGASLGVDWANAWEDSASHPNGVAFQFKGDGSDQWVTLEFLGSGSDSRFAYSLLVPLANSEWHEVRAHVEELTATDTPAYDIGTPGMMPAEAIGRITIGDRWSIGWNNNPLPERSCSIAEIRLISDAVVPPRTVPRARPLTDVLKRMRAGQPVTILCMGDSITAGTGLADREKSRYAVLLQQKLRERLGNDKIVCESRAVGGAKINQARLWAARDVSGLKPDLITLVYGYNDKSALFSPDYFRYELEDYLTRLARLTGGTAALCPIPTLPGARTRFEMMDDYAQQIRDLVATRTDLTVMDLQRPIKAMGRDAWNDLLRDLAHPNEAGHEWLAETMAQWFMQQIQSL